MIKHLINSKATAYLTGQYLTFYTVTAFQKVKAAILKLPCFWAAARGGKITCKAAWFYRILFSAQGYQPLLDYVHENQKDYVENIVLTEMNVLEENEQVIDLLQRNLEELELCCRVVEHERFCLVNLGDCCKESTDVYLGEVKAIWNTILAHERIFSTWNNVMEYWGLFRLTSELTEYIAQHKEALIKSDFSCVDEDFVRDFACSDVDIETYTQILDYLRLEEVDIPLENVAEHKVLALIKLP